MLITWYVAQLPLPVDANGIERDDGEEHLWARGCVSDGIMTSSSWLSARWSHRAASAHY